MDAIPSFAFAVDRDVRIIEYNTAAGTLLDKNRISIINQRAGEALHCIHSHEVPEGCGRAPVCEDCVIRNSVAIAFKGGKIVRKRAKIELKGSDGTTTELFAVITASPFVQDDKNLILLLIEDISELIAINNMVPICMKCKRIRNADEFWTALESYFKDNWGIDFSHGYCPECGPGEMNRIKDLINQTKRAKKGQSSE